MRDNPTLAAGDRHRKRLLFVDDEPLLREMYHMMGEALGEQHEIQTAGSGAEALALLEQGPYDIVVSDLAMPEMDGLQFLNRVVREYPESARIIISGFADRIKLAECLTVGHRYFSKPFQMQPFIQLVGRIVHYSYLVPNAAVRTLICGSGALPTPSEICLRLTEAIDSDYADLDEIARMVERDPGLSTKLLQIVNSAQFGVARAIVTPDEALQIVGMEVLRALVMGLRIFDFYGAKGLNGEVCQRVWNHCLRTARGARAIAQAERLPPEISGQCFLAGLLHDVGELILCANAPEACERALETARQGGLSRTEAERAEIGATHAQVGAYLLALWGLPDPVIQAVEQHHSLDLAEHEGFSTLAAVHAAQCLGPGADTAQQLDLAFIERAGLMERLPDWEMAVREAAESPGSR